MLAGDLTMEEARGLMEKAFGKWKKGEISPRPLPPLPSPSSSRIYLVDKPGAEQSMIVAGNLCLSRSDADYYPLYVLDYALGGYFSSRINLNLREDKGYTYGARVYISSGREVSPHYTYAPVQAEFTGEALTEIFKEFSAVKDSRPLAGKELADTKNVLIKGFPQGFENLSDLPNQMRVLFIYDLPPDNWQTYAQRIQRIDEQEIKRVAQKYIRPEEMVTVVVGDCAKIESVVRALHMGEVIIVK